LVSGAAKIHNKPQVKISCLPTSLRFKPGTMKRKNKLCHYNAKFFIMKINKHSYLQYNFQYTEKLLKNIKNTTHTKQVTVKEPEALHLYFSKEISLRRFEHITSRSPTTAIRCMRYMTNL
jgi:hypothetical protein